MEGHSVDKSQLFAPNPLAKAGGGGLWDKLQSQQMMNDGAMDSARNADANREARLMRRKQERAMKKTGRDMPVPSSFSSHQSNLSNEGSQSTGTAFLFQENNGNIANNTAKTVSNGATDPYQQNKRENIYEEKKKRFLQQKEMDDSGMMKPLQLPGPAMGGNNVARSPQKSPVHRQPDHMMMKQDMGLAPPAQTRPLGEHLPKQNEHEERRQMQSYEQAPPVYEEQHEIDSYHEQKLRADQYARELEMQMREKQMREQQARTVQPQPPQPNNMDNQFQEQKHRAEQYAHELEEQIRQKEQAKLRERALDQQPIQQARDFESEKLHERERQMAYRMELEKQMEAKKLQNRLTSQNMEMLVKKQAHEDQVQDEYVKRQEMERKLQYKRELEAQMRQKQQQQELSTSPPLRPYQNHMQQQQPQQQNMEALKRQQEHQRQQQYARELEAQIYAKKVQQRGGPHHQHVPQQQNQHYQETNENLEKARRQQQYAQDLESQIRSKKTQQQQNYYQQPPPQPPGYHLNMISPRLQKLQQQQQYAQALQQQMEFKKMQQQQQQTRYQQHPSQYQQAAIRQPNLDFDRLERAQKQQQYARELQQQMDVARRLNGTQHHHMPHSPTRGGNFQYMAPQQQAMIPDEKMQKRLQQLEYKRELEAQQRMKDQNAQYEKALEWQLDQKMLAEQQQQQQQQQQGAYQNQALSPTRAHLQSQVFQASPVKPIIGGGAMMPLVSPGGMGGGFAPNGMPLMGAPSPGNGNFTRYKADITDPSVQNEMLEKKRKQMLIQQDLQGQIALCQQRKKEEEEQKKRLEEEEEERISKERAEIQKAYEREQAELKKKQTHQEDLLKQIEEKKRQKKEEEERQRREEAEEEARIQREREELEAKYRNGSQRKMAPISDTPDTNLKQGLFDPPSPCDPQDSNQDKPSLPGTAQLFGGAGSSSPPQQAKPERIPSSRNMAPSPPQQPRRSVGFHEEDAIQKLLRESEVARHEQARTRAALETVKIKLDELNGRRTDEFFKRDVLGYDNYPSPFRRNAQRVLTPPERWGKNSGTMPSPLRQSSLDESQLFRGNQYPSPLKMKDDYFSPVRSNQVVEEEKGSLPSTGMHSPSVDLMRSLYPNFGKDMKKVEPTAAHEKRDYLKGSLHSESKFIFPNGQAFTSDRFPTARRVQNSNSPVPRPSSLQLEEKVPSSSMNMQKLDQQKRRLQEREREDDDHDHDHEPERVSSPHNLLASPGFDIYRLHEDNRVRLEKLETIGDCANLKGDQLDAFLEDFLAKHDPLLESKERRRTMFQDSRPLDCETRWINKNY